GDTTVTTEGANQEVTGTVTDLAGNTTSFTVSAINIDKTEPTISAVRTDANANGWNNGDVAVTFSGSDDLSGVDSIIGDTTVTTEGANQEVTGTVTDLAGNSTSFTVSAINIDNTAPTISAVRTDANANGWNNGDVAVTFSGSDDLSGVDSIIGDATVSSE